MPIDSAPDTPDRARETPAAPETPGSREPRDGPDAAAFRQQQIAEHAGHHRAADAAHPAAARQTWTKAVRTCGPAMEAPGVTVREAIDLVPDAVRYTLTYDAG